MFRSNRRYCLPSAGGRFCADLFNYSTIRVFDNAGKNIVTFHIRRKKEDDEIFIHKAVAEAASKTKGWRKKRLVVDGVEWLGREFDKNKVVKVSLVGPLVCAPAHLTKIRRLRPTFM